MQQQTTPQEAVVLAIRAIFERWTALRLTIEHQYGGSSDKANELVNMTIAMATKGSKQYSQDELADFFYAEFDRMGADIEDGSVEEVSNIIVRVRDAALIGNIQPAKEVVEKAGVTYDAYKASVNGDNMEEDEVEHKSQEDNSRPRREPQQPVVDEDGFVEVQSRRRHR